MALAKSVSLPNLQVQRPPAQPKTLQGSRAPGQEPTSPPRGSPASPTRTLARSVSGGRLATLGQGTGKLTGRMVVQGFWGKGPPRAGARDKVIPQSCYEKQHVFEAHSHPSTDFRRFYERGDIPVVVRHGATPGVEWKVEPERLDYVHYLPMFFDGLLEKTSPYDFMAQVCAEDMLKAATGKSPSLIAPAIPSIIVPMKRALNTKDPTIVAKTIRLIQAIVRADPAMGVLLVPYYRMILPVFNMFISSNLNIGDSIDYGQRHQRNLGDLIADTLAMLESTGGEHAYINIKYMIPTYESVVSN